MRDLHGDRVLADDENTKLDWNYRLNCLRSCLLDALKRLLRVTEAAALCALFVFFVLYSSLFVCYGASPASCDARMQSTFLVVCCLLFCFWLVMTHTSIWK